jgi:hypothetical protein
MNTNGERKKRNQNHKGIDLDLVTAPVWLTGHALIHDCTYIVQVQATKWFYNCIIQNIKTHQKLFLLSPILFNIGRCNNSRSR